MLVKWRALTAGLLFGTQLSFSATCAAAQSGTSAGNFPFCSWWTETTATSLNVAFPDASAAYWTTPLLITPDLQW
jgi:hypothetical protein